MNLERVKQIADAVLYEGYILYPYRASAVKNRQRFNFGVLVPRAYSEAQPGSEAWTMQTECLVEGDSPRLDVHVRFLQLTARDVGKVTGQANSQTKVPAFDPVPALEIDGNIHQAWQEAVEREITAMDVSLRDLLTKPQTVPFTFGPHQETERLHDANDDVAGVLVRRQQHIHGAMVMAVQPLSRQLWKLRIGIENHSSLPAPADRSRADALAYALASTHTLLGIHGGSFVSLLDPPDGRAEAAAGCNNTGTWPVLVGEEGERDGMLSSPIILYDYPQIAPESGGDFCDGTEIDEMLALRVMTLTEEEKREMRGIDARAREILERTESMPQEHWQKLHGAIRGLKRIGRDGRETRQ